MMSESCDSYSGSEQIMSKRHMYSLKCKSLTPLSACKLCGELCRLSHQDKHLEIHSGVRPHVCHICGLGFKKTSGVDDHIITHIGKRFVCLECGQHIIAKFVYKHKKTCLNMRLQAVEPTHKKRIVELETSISNAQEAHSSFYDKEGQKQNPETKIGSAFGSVSSLPSPVTKFESPSESLSVKQERTCHPSGDFTSYFTGEIRCEDSIESLPQKVIHNPSEDYSSLISSLDQKSEDSAKCSTSTLDEAPAKPLLQLTCEEFSKKGPISLDYNLVDGKYACSYCGKAFKTKWHLKDHYAVHNTEKLYKCNLCLKRFVSKDYFRRHNKRGHSGEGSFELLPSKETDAFESEDMSSDRIDQPSCPSADQSSSHEAGETVDCHIKESAGENQPSPAKDEVLDKPIIYSTLKPYACEICGRLFAGTWCLKVHEALFHRKKDDKKFKFKCSFCNNRFCRAKELFHHKLIFHSCLKQHTYAVCDRRFDSKRMLIQHAKRHKKKSRKETAVGGLYSCMLCQSLFGTQKEMKQHTEAHKTARLYSCFNCKKTFDGGVQLYQHSLAHSENSLFCSWCSRSFLNKDALLAHIKAHTLLINSGNTYENLTCNPNIIEDEKQQIDDRITSSSMSESEKSFICPKCNSQFKTKMQFDRHIQAKIGRRALRCLQCERSFISVTKLDLHVEQAHQETDCVGKSSFTVTNDSLLVLTSTKQPKSKYMSNILSSTSDEKAKNNTGYRYFRRNVKTWSLERPFECLICGFSFKHKNHLNDHMFVHSEEKSFHCLFCTRRFSHKSTFRKHLQKVHGVNFTKIKKENPEERPHKCSSCSKAFKYKNHLKEHEALHSQIKPYTCFFCGKGYPSLSTLKKHEKTHDRTSTNCKPKRRQKHENKFSCDICGRRFPSNTILQEHILSQHKKEISFICTICGQELSSRYNLNRHTKKHAFTPKECELCGSVLKSASGLRKHWKNNCFGKQPK